MSNPVAAALYLTCAAISLPASAQAATASVSKPVYGTWGVDLSDQDRSVRPGDDFAMYQFGGWFKRTELKPGQSLSAYWRDLRSGATTRMDQMMANLDAESSAKQNPIEALVSAFHRSASAQVVDAKGLAPLQPELQAIRSVKDKKQFARLMGAVEGPGTLRLVQSTFIPGRNLYGVNIVQDQQDPGRYAVFINQAGLLLPGPDYYADPAFKDLRTAYQAAVAKLLRHIAWADPDRTAQQIVDLETKIALASSSREELRDPAKTYHRLTLAQLRRQAPGFDWAAFMKGAELPADALIAVDIPTAIGRIAKVYAEAPLDVLKAKEAVGAVYVDAPLLDAKTYQIYKEFTDSVLPGIQSSPTRVLDVTHKIESSVPDAINALYVKRYFSPEAKAKALIMTSAMKDALDRRISQSPWLSAEGKRRAHEKIATLAVHIGYPDKFEDYRGLVIKDDDFFGNVSRSSAYAWREQVAQLKQPFDRSKWAIAVFYAQFNYIPSTNTIEVPAGLLAPPFFDLNADDAVNYGADGTIIGASIASTIAGAGIDYDASGRLRPSWLPAADRAHFDSARQKIAALYSREQPLPDMHLKGELLVNESLPDIMGTQIALDAYHASLNGVSPPVLDGYSGDQRFFLGRAQMWRAKFSPSALRNQITTGSNTPPYFRLNGPLPNLDQWYVAFDVKPGEKLYLPPEERVRIW
jgi:putative endopeptidase